MNLKNSWKKIWMREKILIHFMRHREIFQKIHRMRANKKYLKYLHAVMDEEAVMELTENQETAVNSDGIMYLTAGSSSGSKYYDLVPRQQTYIANRWQQDVPTYSVVDITETTLTVNTYRTDTQEPIDTQFMLVKSVDHGQLSALIEEAGSKKSRRIYNRELSNNAAGSGRRQNCKCRSGSRYGNTDKCIYCIENSIGSVGDETSGKFKPTVIQ